MFELFTIEEVNLMCIFNTSGRSVLITDLTAAVRNFDEPELIEITETTINKLYKMSDTDFTALEFYPEYEDYNEGQEV
jgi:D-arabinose 5-phosphate isomerase GutQ